MKPAIVFFDIDGTLLDHQKLLPESTKLAVHQLHQAGHVVAIATARSPFMFEHLAQELNIRSYVSINGQYVVLEGEVIHSNPIEPEIVCSLTDYANDLQHPLIYADHVRMRTSMDRHRHVESCFASLKFPAPEYDPTYPIDRAIYQSIIFCTPEEEISYREAFPELNFLRWHDYAVDAIPVGRSKAYGIKQIINKLGISPDEVYAFGDSFNDMEMLRYVGKSVAMGNAPDQVKKEAKFVTKAVDDDGILYGLTMMGLL